jgi:hypothetical protein
MNTITLITNLSILATQLPIPYRQVFMLTADLLCTLVSSIQDMHIDVDHPSKDPMDSLQYFQTLHQVDTPNQVSSPDYDPQP